MESPPTAAEYRQVLEVIREALAIPHAKTTGGDQTRSAILHVRVTSVKIMIDALLQGSSTPAWNVAWCRENLAKHPAQGYHPFTAPMDFSLSEKCANDGCGHPQGSHWEHAEPDGERKGCAYLGCTCTAYADDAAVLATSIASGQPVIVTDDRDPDDPQPYCEAPDPDGRWHCALPAGHDGHHFSPREMAEVPAWWPGDATLSMRLGPVA